MMIAPMDYAVELVEKANASFTPFFEYAAGLGLNKPEQLKSLEP